MKKVMLMVAFMVATVAASAQVYIGGGLGVNSYKPIHQDGVDVDATTTFSIIPEIGYNLDDKWTVGIGIGYEHASNISLTTFIDETFDRQKADSILEEARKDFWAVPRCRAVP